MSQFFKALEQAERDRLREKESSAASVHPPQAVPPPPPTAAAVVEVPVARAEPTPERVKPEITRPAAKAAPKPEPIAPISPVPPVPPVSPLSPASSPTTVSHPTTVSQAPPPAPVFQAPPPATVFRPALRTRDREVRHLRRSASGQPLLIAQSDPDSIEADAYRTVRTKIEQMVSDRACRHIAITSVTNGDGKSTSAANLAVVFAQSGRRVCLVDGDLRRPTLHELFGLPNVEGLTSALTHGKPLHTVAKSPDIENLAVVVAGRGSQETFQDLLTPQRLERVLRESEAGFDLVLFDTPPVIAAADALNVAAVCDGVILVVRAGSVPLSVLRRATEQIGQVKGRVVGVLLNRVDLRAADADFYRYYRGYHAISKE
jgi:protein-tyrosine kinase